MMYDIYDLEDGLVIFHPISKKQVWIMKDEVDDIINIWAYRWQWNHAIREHNIYEELP